MILLQMYGVDRICMLFSGRVDVLSSILVEQIRSIHYDGREGTETSMSELLEVNVAANLNCPSGKA